MSELLSLKPNEVWSFFDQITKIPRPSKKEEKIVSFLEKFALDRKLKYKKDKLGNITIFKPATKGKENCEMVVLQAHVDMVCEKNADKVHNFERDAIVPLIEDGWVKADGTTLGADDGIGVAAALAVLDNETIAHGSLQCLFTIDEETGLTGAFGLEDGFIEGRKLINLDSEDEGELFIGCAGGIGTEARFRIYDKETSTGCLGIKVTVKGLNGGHSGDDIDKGHANANKLIARFVKRAIDEVGFELSDIQGGNLHNAIAREASAVGVVPFARKEEIRILFNIFSSEIQDEYHAAESAIDLHLETVDLPSKVFTTEFQNRLIMALIACPHGVVEMCHDIPGLVETSTNLASIKREENTIVVVTSQRSSVESAKEYVKLMVASTFKLAGADVCHSEGYPGWTPNVNSQILAVTVDAYKQLFGVAPKVRAIHAGLECGLFLKKNPGLDMISFGPTLRGVHSPTERIEIESVGKFWDLLLAVLARL